MIPGRRRDISPSLSSVFRKRHCAARADDNRAFGILNKESIEAGDDPRVLALPLKATVAGIQNHSVGSHGPTMTLVGGETNRANGVPLRSRVLPFPSAIDCLSKDRCGAGN